eukprot:scaffold1130_cov195-Pinguiococcus_pyrenoidosus.AAC.37
MVEEGAKKHFNVKYLGITENTLRLRCDAQRKQREGDKRLDEVVLQADGVPHNDLQLARTLLRLLNLRALNLWTGFLIAVTPPTQRRRSFSPEKSDGR